MAKKSKGKKRKNDLSKRERDGKISKEKISLPQLLKKNRGTAATTPLPPAWSKLPANPPKFLTPDDEGFENLKSECYRGFVYENPKDIDDDIHECFSSSFHGLDQSGLFLYDVVQPGGKKLSLTFVSRTLVGNSGSTYKYLGLRLFSHPWYDVTGDGDEDLNSNIASQKTTAGESLVKLGYSKKCAKALIKLGIINKKLRKRTDHVLQREIAPLVKDNLVGSADYTITLINKMEPTRSKKDLKNDKVHGLGKTSVSWHKDSGLNDFSSIAVYHQLENTSDDIPWKVALRVADANVKTPALSVPLPSKSLYYLLDDFNHQHEHAVIAGSNSLRYSSTHRVARDGAGTYQYIRDKCRKVLSYTVCKTILKAIQSNTDPSFDDNDKPKVEKELRACNQLITELEFEWIRQWYIQGKLHARLHPYWEDKISYLEECYLKLHSIVNFINSLFEENRDKYGIITEDLFDIFIEHAESRNDLRLAWKQRLKDSVFKSLDVQARPFECSTLNNCKEPGGIELRQWKSNFCSKGTTISKKRKREKKSALTKKEKKRVASNWEKMKKKF